MRRSFRQTRTRSAGETAPEVCKFPAAGHGGHGTFHFDTGEEPFAT
jgi:hypothetical protein